MNEFWQKYKAQIIIISILVILTIIGLVIWWIYSAGKNAGVSSTVATAPDVPGQSPYTPAERALAKPLSDRLYTELVASAWLAFFDYNDTLYQDCDNSSDRVLVLTYNQYSIDHSPHNLITDLQNKSYLDVFRGGDRDTLVARLQNLIANQPSS